MLPDVRRDGRPGAARRLRGAGHPAGAAHGLVRRQHADPRAGRGAREVPRHGHRQAAAGRRRARSGTRRRPSRSAPTWSRRASRRSSASSRRSSAAPKVVDLLANGLEGVVGAKFAVEPDPETAAILIRKHIETKRKGLGLPYIEPAQIDARRSSDRACLTMAPRGTRSTPPGGRGDPHRRHRQGRRRQDDLTAALARLLAREGRRVLAVDADAQLNLAAALGIPRDDGGAPRPALAPPRLHRGEDRRPAGRRDGALSGSTRTSRRRRPVRPGGARRRPAPGHGHARPGRAAAASARRTRSSPRRSAPSACARARRSCSTPRRASSTSAEPSPGGSARPSSSRTRPTAARGVAISAARFARELGIPSVHLVVNRVRDDADRERSWPTSRGARADVALRRP